jgi:predicted Rossmann fold flavoprotein
MNSAQSPEEKIFDVVILGAGGAGMMCAIQAARRGKSVAVLDHAAKVGGKILISGGGRCNFTNTGASASQYVSANLQFAQSALSRFKPQDFIKMVEEHGIAFHEKKLGQLFCDDSARSIVDLLVTHCNDSGAQFFLDCKISGVKKASRFEIKTNQGTFSSQSLVIATGGLSIPKLGATGLGYELAQQFGHQLVELAPALDGFVFAAKESAEFNGLAGVSADVVIKAGGKKFRENILFTHAGLSGPAALQASLHWYPADVVEVNLSPDKDVLNWLKEKRKEGARSEMKNLISEIIPRRLAERFCELYFPKNNSLPLPQLSDKILSTLSNEIQSWKFVPSGTVGYSKAEVTRGGVDTDGLSSKTLESKLVSDLYFIGEVVDVTGWLGGYNFQWAWASGHAAGQVAGG